MKRYLVGSWWGNKKIRIILIVTIVAIMGSIAWYIKSNTDKRGGLYTPAPNQANNDLISRVESSSNIDDKRTLVSGYLANGEHQKAANVALEIASDTGNSDDYLTLLNICSSYEVTEKAECVNDAKSVLLKEIKDLNFRESYNTAFAVERFGDKKSAATFYERALEQYNNVPIDEFTMTPEQLKKHINELKR